MQRRRLAFKGHDTTLETFFGGWSSRVFFLVFAPLLAFKGFKGETIEVVTKGNGIMVTEKTAWLGLKIIQV